MRALRRSSGAEATLPQLRGTETDHAGDSLADPASREIRNATKSLLKVYSWRDLVARLR
jgi:hypothetical protein